MNDLIPADMTDAAMWSVVVGFFVPLVLSFVVSATWPKWAKALAVFVLAAIVGTITALIAGAYEGLGIPSAVLLTLVVAITAYQNFWRQVGLSNRGSTTPKDGTGA